MLFYLSLLETEEQKKNFIEIYGRNRGNMYCVAQGILGQKEEAELIRRLLRELPAAYHDILVLRYYYGFSVKEAAKILGISQNAAQVRLHRVKEKLGEALDEEGMR